VREITPKGFGSISRRNERQQTFVRSSAIFRKDIAWREFNMNHSSKMDAIRKDLDALANRIEETRVALDEDTRLGDRVDHDWEEMLRAHAKRQEALRASGRMIKLVIEGLRLDIDILKYSFGRWAWRNDHKFRGAFSGK
jgi:hypothetical protein